MPSAACQTPFSCPRCGSEAPSPGFSGAKANELEGHGSHKLFTQWQNNPVGINSRLPGIIFYDCVDFLESLLLVSKTQPVWGAFFLFGGHVTGGRTQTSA